MPHWDDLRALGPGNRPQRGIWVSYLNAHSCQIVGVDLAHLGFGAIHPVLTKVHQGLGFLTRLLEKSFYLRTNHTHNRSRRSRKKKSLGGKAQARLFSRHGEDINSRVCHHLALDTLCRVDLQ